MLVSDAITNSPNYVSFMVHIAKIFFMSVQVSILQSNDELEISALCIFCLIS